jgi:DNA-binding SARP family transcriptional activator
MDDDDARPISLQLLQGFAVSVGPRPVSLISSAQRLLAFLALQERQVARAQVAAALWPQATAARANASLRSALWRAQRPCGSVIETSGTTLALAHDVVVDVRTATAQARRLLDGGPIDPHSELLSLRPYLSADVLPDWYDDWVIIEREQYHQLRLHALESLCERLTTVGRVGEAVDAGLAAIRAEPLRESAHRVLIEAHLAAGNRWEALRQFHRCRALLDQELGLEPSATLIRLAGRAGAFVPAQADHRRRTALNREPAS